MQFYLLFHDLFQASAKKEWIISTNFADIGPEDQSMQDDLEDKKLLKSLAKKFKSSTNDEEFPDEDQISKYLLQLKCTIHVPDVYGVFEVIFSTILNHRGV